MDFLMPESILTFSGCFTLSLFSYQALKSDILLDGVPDKAFE